MNRNSLRALYSGLTGEERFRLAWRTILFHKPRGVVTTRRDPQGRRTIYDVIGPAARRLVAVGRLDLATSGLLLLTSDTRLSDWITDPANEVPRIYAVSVRGRVDEADLGDPALVVEPDENVLLVAAERVRVLELEVVAVEAAEVVRTLVVLEDLLAVEIVHRFEPSGG